MFNLIYWPLAAICAVAMLAGMKLFATILGTSLIFVGVVAVLLATFQKHATVMPASQIQEPVQWKPIQDWEWLLCAITMGVLFTFVGVAVFSGAATL